MSWDINPTRRVRTIVNVNSVVRPHEQGGITWAQDITSDLPDPVTAGGQVATRTGTIVWANEGTITRPPSPWAEGGHWMPSIGDRVTVDVTDGTNTHRVFTGVIDTVEGDAFGRRTSKIVAPLRGANRVVRRLAQTQVGGLPGGAVGRFSTTPVWVISEICREIGYTTVPPAPAPSKLILDAPLQGSTYNYSSPPYVNAQVVTSHRAGYPTLHPVWSSGRDGFGISDALIEWEPRTGGGTGAGAVGVSLLVYASHSSDALLRIYHGANADTYVRVTADKRVRVSTYMNGTTVTQTASTPIPAGDGPHRVSVVTSGANANVVVGGVTHTLPVPAVGVAVSKIRLEAGAGSCVAGLQMWHPSSPTDHHASTWAPTAFYRYGTGTHATTLTQSIRDEKAVSVLQGYAGSLLSPLWIDGDGNMQIVTGRALHEQPVTLTVDALSEVSELSYKMDLLDHRPTVEVNYSHAFQSNATSTVHKTKVWQGSGGNVSPDGDDETFVEVPDDEEWIGLADPAAASRLTFDTREAFNTGVGTWWGLSEDVTDGTTLTPTTGGTQIVETLTPWVWKVTTTYPGADGAVLKAPSSAYIKRRYRDMDLPIYRARSLVRYEDRTVSVSTSGATDLDGVLPHDAGKWITTTATASALAQYIHNMVGTPTPVLDGLRVRFDPRIEVGSKLAVQALAVFGVDFQGLVLSVDHDPGADITTVVVRVNWVNAYSDTFDDVDHAHIGQSLASWDAARAGKTLDAVAADPYL